MRRDVPALAAQRGALDDERGQALRRAIDRGAQPRRTAAHDDEVDLLARLELEPDAERP
jgi:hypothetical protein